MERRAVPRLLVEASGDEEGQCFMDDIDLQYKRPRREVIGVIGVVSVFTLILVALAVSSVSHRGSVSRVVPKWTTEFDETQNHRHCHTATLGESCYTDVKWAMTTGIINHPEWYQVSCSWLKSTDSFEEFQACVYRINQTSCPLPCNPKSAHSDKPQSHMNDQADPCHIATEGEACYDTVLEAMALDIDQYKARFPGLPDDASFEAIQAALHADSVHSKCPRPCSCHTVVASERCHQHVLWAMKEGIRLRPSWYIGVTVNSSFEEVQAYLHKDAKGTCPLPCSAVTVDSVRGAATHHVVKTGLPKHGSTTGRVETSEAHCHPPVVSEKCNENVMYAMRQGLFAHPEWYPGLNTFSSFEEFQAILHQKHPVLTCPRPCPCATAKKGDKCYANVKWVLHEGIPRHPEWYPDLTERSRWETVQLRLHEDANTTCQTPCTPKVWGKPSLFCFAVFRSAGYELDLVKSQVNKGVGIFSCDEFAVLSDKELKVTDVINTLIIPPCEKVGTSKDGTAANTLVFIQAWSVIWKDTRYKAHDWVIKADPDAVVIVDRLRRHLAPYTGQNVFIKNCMKFTGPGWPMMFGSLEAFSHDAIEAYFKGADRCQTELQWEAWGEDLFMGNCLSMLGTKSVFDGGIIGDNVCKGANCADGTTAVYHPFKSTESWFKCYNEALSTVFK